MDRAAAALRWVMRHRLVGLFVLVTGCSLYGGDDAVVTDGAPIDTPWTCLDCDRVFPCTVWAPAGQQGCATGLRCTWVTDAEAPDVVGRSVCVPEGTVGLGEACTAPALGQPDACVTGTICQGGACRDICGFAGSGDVGCGAARACARISGLFTQSGEVLAGICADTCDPLTQQREAGGACEAGSGCYVLSDEATTIAVCARAGTRGHGEAIDGPTFANSCVPGAQPRVAVQGSGAYECGGLCRPAAVTSTSNQASEGGVAPDSCQARWGAAPPEDGTAGESCRYWWARERFTPPSAFGNSLGWCVKHATFRYDTNGDMQPDAPFPRCTAVTTGDVLPPVMVPPQSDAEAFWCVPKASTSTARPGRRGGAAGHLDRLAR